MRRFILVLITLLLMLVIKAAHAQSDAANAGVDWNDGESIQDTWHGVATTGLVFAAVIGGLLTALRVRATHQRQHDGQGGPQQLGLSQIPVQEKGERPR
jgi:Na+/glutamate symporter